MDIVESRLKYGTEWNDDLDELAAALSGNPIPMRAGRMAGVAEPSESDDVDADFLRRAASPANHYGN